MSVKRWCTMLWLPWASLPLLLCAYALVWERLPVQLVVQVSTSGEATNIMSKRASLALDAAILLFILGSFTFKLSRSEGERAAATALPYYFAVLVVLAVFLWTLWFNL